MIKTIAQFYEIFIMIESRYSSTIMLTDAHHHSICRIASYFYKIVILFIALLITSCTTTPTLNKQPISANYTLKNRNAFLTTVNNWQINGKIAFINGKERKSANIFWQNNPVTALEQLNLTTYLGINVLDVTLSDNIYTVNVDNNSYQHTDIDYILQSLTGYQLPSQALKSWIKAIPFHSSDKVTLHQETQLPLSITSYYNDKTWQIRYQNYSEIKGIPLPKRLTIKQQDLTIKLVINQWQF